MKVSMTGESATLMANGYTSIGRAKTKQTSTSKAANFTLYRVADGLFILW